MHHRAPGNLSLSFSLNRFLCLFVVAALALCSISPAARSVNASQTNGELRLELPANGNIIVENLRGSVIAQVWKENFVSIAAVADSGEPRSFPAVVDRREGLLSIRLDRGPKGAARVNLEVSIPERAHLSINTTDGPVDVRGLPAALLARSVSGEIRLELPARAEATVVADSQTGSVTSSISGLEVNRSSPQVRGRTGRGGSSVRAYSQAGNITLTTAAASSSRVVSSAQERTVPLTQPPNMPSPTQRPELPTPAKTGGAGTPAPVSPGPEEISEGDVIRVDTELVSVNVSVIDRGTNRGVSDLTKDDFRLYEDNAQQQIVHFESASAPFNLVLLIDLSGSTTKVVELIKAAALHFVDAARPFDRIAVITFAGGQVVVSPLTSDHNALRQRISAIQRPEGSTKLYDSVVFAVDETFREAKDSRGRNAIVVISDGLDSVMPNVTGEGSTLKYEEMLRRVKEFDGVLYSIWTDTQFYEPLSPLDIQQETFDLAHDQMRELSDAGGGAFYECERLSDLAGAYDRVVADLGTVYTLSYRPTNKVRDGSWRTIRVNVNRANTVARGKRGYFAK